MFPKTLISRLNLSPKSMKCFLGALLFFAGFQSFSVRAEDAAAFRTRLIKEVLLEVPDLEMAKQIVEIRIKREFLKPTSQVSNALMKNELSIQPPAERKVRIRQPAQVLIEQSDAFVPKPTPKLDEPTKLEPNVQSVIREQEAYVGVGNRLVIGYAYPLSSKFSLRADASGLPPRQSNKSIDGNQFVVNESNTSLGAYLDWFPQGDNFRFSLGVNANRMRTKLQSVQGTNANINGKSFNTGTEVLDVTYKFPLYTPYFGLGYQSSASDEGWSIYADLGLMIGKYDAHARTSMVGLHAISKSDVDSELNVLRSHLFKWSYVPVGAIGIKYRY